MKFNVLSSLALATAFFGVTAIEATSVSAAVMNFDFTVDDIIGGSLEGDTFTGSFSFDDAGIADTGFDFVPFESFSFDFQGTEFTEADNIADGAIFVDGDFIGIDYDANTGFSFEAGFGLDDGFFAYDFGSTDVGEGIVTITPGMVDPEPNAVPEPATVIGLLTTMAVATKIKANKTAAKN